MSGKEAGMMSRDHGVSPPASSDSSIGQHSPHEKNAVLYSDGVEVPSYSKKEELKLVSQIDWRVLPILCAMFTLAFLDKVNIANAQVFGLSKELKLEGTQFNNCLVVQYIPYLIFEIPSNILLKKFSPNVWLSLFMFLFGLICMCQGFVNSYGSLVAVRFLLGCAEVPMFPGAFYVISMWYKRSEALKRFTFFYNSIALAGAFGGLAAYGIGHMAGDQGYEGWRWIFIIEGAVTAFLAFIFFFLIPDFPEEAKWPTPEQKAFIKARLAEENGKAALDRPVSFKDVTELFSDWKIWVAGFLYFGCATPGYAYSFFSPTIIKGFGLSALNTQLYGVAPWAAAWVIGMATAFVSDWFKHRYIFIIIGMCMSIVGTAVLLTTTGQLHLQYGMLFLFIMGIYMALPTIVCWFNMNLAGHHRRAIGGAWMIGIGQAGGIVAVYTFIAKDAPKYVPGYSICIAFDVFTIITATAYFFGVWTENKRRDRIMRSQNSEGVVASQAPIDEQERAYLGDRALDWRYMT